MWKCSTLIMMSMLGGCASFSYFSESYGALQPQVITTKTDSWWVFDKASEGKVLVQRNSGSAAGLGLNPTTAVPRPDYQEAAEAFLSQSGRTCKIKDGSPVIAPSWEFSYVCDGPANLPSKKG